MAKDKEQDNNPKILDELLPPPEIPKAAAEKPQRFIYCGPSIPGGRLNQFAVFKGGCPEYLIDLYAACPAVKELFVPVADLPKIRIALGQPGSEASNLFNEVWQYVKKEVTANV